MGIEKTKENKVNKNKNVRGGSVYENNIKSKKKEYQRKEKLLKGEK